jgi:valyl-tRNA synthetase
VLAYVLDTTLRLLHPVMPFITERLWHLMNEKGSGHGAQGAGDALCVATWPSAAAFPRDPAVEEEIQHTLDVIRVLRDIRAQVNAMRSQAKEKALRTLPRALVRAEGDVATQLRSHLPMLIRLGQCDAIEIDAHAQKPPKSASKVLHGVEIYVPLDGLADPSIETGRLEKERDQLLKHLKGLDGKLANEKFVNNAAADVVQRERDRHAQLKSKLDAVQRNLADLG